MSRPKRGSEGNSLVDPAVRRMTEPGARSGSRFYEQVATGEIKILEDGGHPAN